ncbi:hypothetical protein [Acrocarpospora sp. B8E8]|uniref:hypothetical protein n=1 Tax=Acrocarpospora sp. B8E8 TaxID=3153572 RepID=UPI00325CA3EE
MATPAAAAFIHPVLGVIIAFAEAALAAALVVTALYGSPVHCSRALRLRRLFLGRSTS